MLDFFPMQLESLEAQDFRNLRGQITCNRGLNIMLGDNGQGKTNWLESIYVLATSKSFKTAKLPDAIRFGEEMACVRGTVRQSAEIRRDMQVTLQGNSKSLIINGKKETAASYLGELHAVIFNADGLEIIRGLPEARRRFLDGGIVSIHPPYLQTIADYNRVLRQKNTLLYAARSGQLSDEKTAEMLVPWNQQLTALAGRIHKARTRFVERLNQSLEKKLFAGEEVSIRYASSLEGKGDLADYEALMAERLKVRHTAEITSGHALIGTHRDDLDIRFDGHDMRKYGSAGQQRSALLVLQLANISVYFALRGEYPLFLLDDIDAELDYRRIGQLLDFLHGKTQTFVTTSKESFVETFGANKKVFVVENGEAKIL